MSKTDYLRVTDYLHHIIEAIERIDRYTTDMSEIQFLNDDKTQDAVIRNFEIIGEACNNISKKYADFAKQHSEIPWGFAYEMRNALAHGYHKVDFEIVWNTIHRNLYSLSDKVKVILETNNELDPRNPR